MPEDKLTRDDLVLLMESYRNMIDMHHTILEQTNKTIERLDTIATKQDTLFSKQGSICNSLGKITDKLEDCSDNLKDTATKVDNGMSAIVDKVDSSKGEITTKISNHEVKVAENHGKLVNKIHLGWIGMGSIIVSLIALIVVIINIFAPVPTP